MMAYTILALLLVVFVWGWLVTNYFRNPVGRVIYQRFTLDYYLSAEVSNALKGASAVVIVCHHWCLYNSQNIINGLSFIDLILPVFGGNFSLVIFLFLSGYGITKSEVKSPNGIKKLAKKRVWKIYKHALIIYAITALVYMFALSSPVDASLVKEYHLNPFIED